MSAEIILGSAYLGMLLLIGSTVFGATLAAFASELSYLGKKRKFLDKYGQQSASLSGKSLALFLLLLLPLLLWLPISPQELPDLVKSREAKIAFCAAAPLLLGWLGACVYSGTWQYLQQRKWLHLVLGVVSLLAMLAGTYFLANVSLANKAGIWSELLPLEKEIWFPAVPTVWPAWLAVILNGAGSAGAAAMVYLFLRREKDDFGRDYYRFALPRAAKWSLALVLPVGIWAGWIYSSPLYLDKQTLILSAIVVVALLLALVLSAAVIRSPHPLRLKLNAALVLLLTWIVDSVMVLSLLSKAGV